MHWLIYNPRQRSRERGGEHGGFAKFARSIDSVVAQHRCLCNLDFFIKLNFKVITSWHDDIPNGACK